MIHQCEGRHTENGNFRLDLIFSLGMAPAGFHPHPSVEELPWRNWVSCPTQRLEGQSRRQDFSLWSRRDWPQGVCFTTVKLHWLCFGTMQKAASTHLTCNLLYFSIDKTFTFLLFVDLKRVLQLSELCRFIIYK